MLITLGALVAIDHSGYGLSFWRTWPLLFIVYGVLKLVERLLPRPAASSAGRDTSWEGLVRRVSYIGPLLLILIGGVFLMHNMYPDLPLADWFAQFWPFLLIGWGVLRLIEILTWAFMKRPLPSNGITCGEWALVVLLFVIGSGKNSKIIIESFRGNARIVGADTTEVKVTGRKTVRAPKQTDADQANSQTRSKWRRTEAT